jgi:glucokinase
MIEVCVIDGSGKSVLVYDVGGSHVSAAVCRQGAFRLGPVVSAPHPVEPCSEAFVNLLHSLGTQASANFDSVLGAELAMPGPFDYATGISQMTHKLPYLFGVDLRAALAQCFAWQPCKVRFLNDAAAYLLGEVGAGAARNVQRAVCITLGTGVGSGFAVDGHVVTDGPGVPPGGEIWNLPYEGGILEDAISTRAIQGSYQRRTGKLCKVSELAASAKIDPIAGEVFAEFGAHLGQALKSVVSEFAPEVIVLGGGISRSAHLFLPQAQRELNDQHLELRVSTLMDQAPLVGAGVAWFDEEAKASQAVSQALQATTA